MDVPDETFTHILTNMGIKLLKQPEQRLKGLSDLSLFTVLFNPDKLNMKQQKCAELSNPAAHLDSPLGLSFGGTNPLNKPIPILPYLHLFNRWIPLLLTLENLDFPFKDIPIKDCEFDLRLNLVEMANHLVKTTKPLLKKINIVKIKEEMKKDNCFEGFYNSHWEALVVSP